MARPHRRRGLRRPRGGDRDDDRLQLRASPSASSNGRSTTATTSPRRRSAATIWKGPPTHLPVPFNRVMVGTFFLAGMDIAHRIITWFDDLEMPWERTMVIIAGRQGRPTAGVTTDTNSVAGVIEAASRGRLPARHLLIAPHAPVFPMFDGSNLDPVAALEQEYRRLWSGVIATSELGGQMFDGFPHFAPPSREANTIGSANEERDRHADHQSPGRLARADHPAARGARGSAPAPVRCRHRLRESAAGRQRQSAVSRHRARARWRALPPAHRTSQAHQ